MSEVKSVFEDSVENDLLCSEFGSRLLSRFTLGNKIHHSNNSQIFFLTDNATRYRYILKAVANKNPRLDLETLKTIRHPDIIKIYLTESTDKYIYTIKEYVEGITLEQYIINCGPLSEDIAIDIINKICGIFQYLHSLPMPVIYRDLKPANIMLTKDNKLKLVDLDSIRQYKDSSSKDTVFIGTEGFAAPEQFGFSQSDVRTDIYTIGTTLYYLLSGQNPVLDKFRLRNIREVRRGLSSKICHVIEKATMFNPDDRYQSIEELRNDLPSQSGMSARSGGLGLVHRARVIFGRDDIRRSIVSTATSMLLVLLFTFILIDMRYHVTVQRETLAPGDAPGPVTADISGTNEQVVELTDKRTDDVTASALKDGSGSELTIPENPIPGNASLSVGISRGMPVSSQDRGKPVISTGNLSLDESIQYKISPDLSYISPEKVLTIYFPRDSVIRQYCFDGINWMPYKGSIVITEDCIVYARAYFKSGKSIESKIEVSNVQMSSISYYVKYDLDPKPHIISEQKVLSMDLLHEGGILEYSFDNINWILYEEPLTFTQNSRIYIRDILDSGRAVYGWIDIDNISEHEKLSIIHETEPEYELPSSIKILTITYPEGSIKKEYSFDYISWFEYKNSLKLTKNCYIYTRALMPDGRVVNGGISINNIEE